MIYSDQGYLTQSFYFDREGNHQPGPDHAYGRKFEYDRNGQRTSMTSVNQSGENLNDTAGNATLRASYDSASNLTRAWALDAAGQPTLFRMGPHEYRHASDQYGNLEEINSFDKEDRPALNQYGVHSIRMKHDDKGIVTSTAFYDRGGRATISKDGYHRTAVLNVGPYGQWSEVAFFNPTGDRTTDHQGAHRYARNVDSNGLELSRKAFDVDLQPVAANEGCYEVRNTYDAEKRRGDSSGYLVKTANRH